jgi:hypothetical protein
LYLVALLAAIEDMTRLHVGDSQMGMRQVVVGSEHELRERQNLADQLKVIFSAIPIKGREMPEINVLPEYFRSLLDLADRLMRLRAVATDALRVLEFVGVETVAGRGAAWGEAYPDGRLASKLAGDVVRFLVRACGLDSAFVAAFDATLVPPQAQVTGIGKQDQAALFGEADLAETVAQEPDVTADLDRAAVPAQGVTTESTDSGGDTDV